MAKLNIDLKPALKNLDIITKGLVNTKTIGRYKSKFKGKGREFQDYREYGLGYDDARLLDWKASMRSNKLLIKEFVEERNINVFFLIDVSESMIFGSTKILKMEYAAQLIASLYFVILKAGDMAGFALFNDKLVTKKAPGRNKNAFYVLSRSLVDIKNYGGKFDLGEAIRLSLSFLKQNDVLIIVSDFIGLKPDWEKSLRIASAQYDVVGIMVRDPNDKSLPPGTGQVILESPYSDEQLLVDPQKIKSEYSRYTKQQEEIITKEFLKQKSSFLSLTTDMPFIKPLTEFFKKRGSL